MHFKVFRSVATAAALALAATATAQTVSLGPQRAVPSVVSKPAVTTPPLTGKPIVEPVAMAGMLAAQNGARQRIGLPPLAWSSELAARAEAAASAEAEGKCSSNSAASVAAAQGVAIYWAAGLNRLGGAPSVQTILPSFLVSEWSAGRGDYDLARHTCRRSGPCDQYARMVSPDARQVGCARAICPSNAQVWVCRYDDSAPAAVSSPPR
jgi:pathogenesis-related protein 1